MIEQTTTEPYEILVSELNTPMETFSIKDPSKKDE